MITLRKHKSLKAARAVAVAALLMAFGPGAAADNTTWNVYPSYNDITEIEPAGQTCFALASGSVFSYNINGGELSQYDKANVMSDVNAKHIAWSQAAKRLIVVYDNANIDLLNTAGDVVNLPDLYQKSTTLDKTVNNIYINDVYAYLSTAFGIVKVNMRDAVISDSYQLDINVAYCYIDGGYLYAASREGGCLKRASLSDNLLDKNVWQICGDFTENSADRLNVKDPTTKLWWTRTEQGKLTYYYIDDAGNRTYMTEGVLPNGPSSNNFFRLYSHGGKLYATGGLWSQEKNGNCAGEVHVWDGASWTEFEKPTEAQLGHRNVDYICLDFDPKTEGHVAVGAKSGVYEFQDGKFLKCYNSDNSPLESSATNKSKDYVIASSLKYDASGNLWVLNRLTSTPIKRLSPDGEWTSLAQSALNANKETSGNLTSMFLSTTYGHFIFVNNFWEVTKVYAYDYQNDKLYTLGGQNYTNEDGSEIRPYYLYGASEDKDGNIWLATSSGPLYMTPSDVKSGNSTVTQYKVPRNDGTNLADYLLANVETRCVKFDGAGRKWIGTSSGVFLISEDNNTQLQHFTAENSPLLSNVVHDILIDPNSNVVYFATDCGLCSYTSDATTPNDTMDKDNVYAYPNPVTPDFTGDITIVGLSYNADVKIVTTSGVLVNQGRSTGGSYRWDCRDQKGKRVASGIYMVETAKQDGSKGTVCKIAVIN